MTWEFILPSRRACREDSVFTNSARPCNKSNDWGSSLTSEILQEIALHAGAHSWASLRCVCQNWRRGISGAVRTVRLTVPDHSTVPAQQVPVEPAAAEQQRPTRKGPIGGRPTGRGVAATAAAAAAAGNHEQDQNQSQQLQHDEDEKEKAVTAAAVATTLLTAGHGSHHAAAANLTFAVARPGDQSSLEQLRNPFNEQIDHQHGRHQEQQQPTTTTGRGFAASSGRPPINTHGPETGTHGQVNVNAATAAVAAVPAGLAAEPATGGDASFGRIVVMPRSPPSCFEPRPAVDSLVHIFNLQHQSTVAAVAAAAATAAAATGAPRMQGQVSDSQAAGVASSVGSSSIVVWSFLEAADRLATAFPSYNNLSLNFAEPLPLAACGGGEVGSGRWLQREMTTTLEKLLSSRLVSMSICGHIPYPLFMAPPPPPPPSPPALPVAQAASPPHQQEPQHKHLPQYQEGTAAHRGPRFCQQMLLTEIAPLNTITVAEALEALEDDDVDRPMGQCSAGPNCGVCAGSGMPGRRRRRQPSSLAECMMPVHADALLTASNLAEVEQHTARLISTETLLQVQQSSYNVVNPDEVPPGTATAAPLPQTLRPSAANTPSAAIATERRGSPCCSPSHGSLSVRRHDEMVGGHIGGSGSEQDPGGFQNQRRREDAIAAAAICTEMDGSGTVGEGMVPERLGSGVPSTPGLAHCGCYDILEGDNPVDMNGDRNSPNGDCQCAGGGNSAGTCGGVEHMDVEVTEFPMQPVRNGDVMSGGRESADAEDGGGGTEGDHAGSEVHHHRLCPPGRPGAQAAALDVQGLADHCQSHPGEAREITGELAMTVDTLDAEMPEENSQGPSGSGAGGGGHSGVVSATCRKTAPLKASAATPPQLSLHAAARPAARANGAFGVRVAAAAINAAAGVIESATRAGGWHCAGSAGTAGTMHFASGPNGAGAVTGGARAPPLLSRLSQLVSLTLAADLGFPSPQHLETITSLRNLQKLDMRGAKFMQVEGDASLQARQAWLHVGNEHVAVVARCTSLTSLSLNHLHPVGGQQLVALTALNRLTSLGLTDALSGNTVHGSHIRALAAGLPELRSLEVGRVTCPPLHLPQQHPAAALPPGSVGPAAAAATTAATAGAAGPSGGGGGARQPPLPPPLPLTSPHLCRGDVGGGTRSSSPSSHWPYCSWGPVLGLFHGLTSLHLQVACSFETELLNGVAALPLLEVFSMELLDVPPPQLAAILEVLAAAAPGPPACSTGACADGGDLPAAATATHRRVRRRASAHGTVGGGILNGSLSYVFHGLTLTACMLYDEHLELMGRLGHLRYLRLDHVDIRTRDPDGWTALSGAHALESFSFRAWNNPILSASNLCVLTNDSLAMMAANWPRLQQLSYCGKVALSEKAEEHLARMTCLTSLEITGTDGTSFRVWRSTATGKLLRTTALPHTTGAKVSSRNGYVTYSDSDDSADEGSEASVNWMGEVGYVTSEYDAD
ncbi:hypothetical protein Vafri_506 [Volvox africanus]|nr:hypothetical protein Vafri_506 [Volvox africanus]